MPCSGILIGLVLALAEPAAGPAEEVLLEEAVSLFRQATAQRDQPREARALFRSAAEQFAQLRQHGVHNADLYRNEAHAWLLAGDLPRAILAFRRGLRRAPNDAELRAGLHWAREQVVYPAHSALGRPRVEHWPPWLPRLTPQHCLWLAGLAYGFGCLAGTRWLMVRRRSWLTAAAAAFAAAVVLAVVLLVTESWQRDELSHPVVVVSEDGVLLRKGNGLSYPPRAEEPLNRGMEARLRFVRGAWVQVELASGEVGWVLRDYVLLDPASQLGT